MKPHILFADTGKEWGGGTNSLLLLAAGLKARGYRVAVAFFHDYSGQGKRVSEAFRDASIEFHCLPVPHRKWHKLLRELLRATFFFNRRWRKSMLEQLDQVLKIMPAARQLAALAVEQRADILYGNNQPSSNQEVLLAGHSIGLPVILHVRKTTHLSDIERDLTNTHAARVICVSESVRLHYLAEGLNANRCLVVPNGIDPAVYHLLDRISARKRLGLPEKSFVTGTICSLQPLKCVDHLLRAFAHLKVSTDEEACCVVIGDGPERKRLYMLSKALGIADHCIFAGFQEEAAALLPAFDVFVLPSRQEGMPRSILEAMYAARPTIAAEVAGCRDLVRHGETGFLYPHGDIGALAGLLRKLATDYSLCSRLGNKAREIVLAEYSLTKNINCVAATIDEVVGQTEG